MLFISYRIEILAVTPRVSALAGCYRFGIRAIGYREHRFFIKPSTITNILQRLFKLSNQRFQNIGEILLLI